MPRDPDTELLPPERVVHKGKQTNATLPHAKPGPPDPDAAPANLTRCRATGPCEPCSTKELKTLTHCKETGFREPVLCERVVNGTRNEGNAYHACLPAEEAIGNVGFMFLNLVIFMIAAFVVKWRKRVAAGERNVNFKTVAWSLFRRGV